MTSIVDPSVTIQTSAETVPSTPSWSGEVVLLVSYLRKHGVLTKISERVLFARRRFGHYEVVDFLARRSTSGLSPLPSFSWPYCIPPHLT